jgi:hypothetical protein
VNFLDWLWNLPALPSLVLLDTPFAVAIVWLVWRVRGTVRKTAWLADVMPPITEEEKVALRFSAQKAIKNELELYHKAKGRGEA